MVIEFSVSDICAFFKWAQKEQWAEIFGASVKFTDCFEYKNKKVSLRIKITASQGQLELDVVKASWAGLSIFGVVRKRANQAIMELINGMPYVCAVKLTNGNLGVYSSKFKCNSIAFLNGIISLDVRI
jgi:hypothetical protein